MTGALLVLLAACGPTTVQVEGAAQRPVPAYARVHASQTRELKLYDRLETQLILRATWRGETQRRAAVDELASRGSMTAAERTRLLDAELAELATAHEVVFSGPPNKRTPAAFGFELDSPWRLRLELDQRPCTPLSVEPIDKPSAAQALLYPQLDSWSGLWVARFDRSCGEVGTVRLIVSGAGGSGELVWDEATTG